MSIIELGAGASGFQFCLSKLGLNVVSVDPLENPSESVDWQFTNEEYDRLSRTFGGKVSFIRQRIEDAGIQSNSVDRIFAISVLEHIPENDLPSIMREIERVLRPGGFLIMTIDLFLDLVPFTDVESNIYGRNVSIRSLVEKANLSMVRGDSLELCGYEEFAPARILARAKQGDFCMYNGVLSQGIVLKKPEN